MRGNDVSAGLRTHVDAKRKAEKKGRNAANELAF